MHHNVLQYLIIIVYIKEIRTFLDLSQQQIHQEEFYINTSNHQFNPN